ncbi:ATP-binding protein [Haloarculaceae archaeon H-GB2-1]|nr:GAF domain-containing protein [Haloarculaceae archaeon H-GB1-1]MEA5407360.1 ATP-binding protein [Haloarculaceae archaeon H-GB2-1]
MSFEDQPDFARQVGDLNKYGHALNRCETVEEVVSLTIEAISLLFDVAYSTVLVVREGDLRVAQSTNPALSPEDEPSDVVRRAFERQETVSVDGGEAGLTEESDVTATLAVPAVMGDDVIAVLVMRSKSGEFTDAATRPLEILASHAATAISNIHSRERLERARNDLETRKEMIELYDRLLRHDLGNDLQVVEGFADALRSSLDGENAEYAEKIQRAARSSMDLINRVGEIVSTLEEQGEPEPRDLRSIIETVVETVDAQYESLTIEFDPDAFDYHVYGGELLGSVFTNIISNAAIHNDGPVSVRLSVDDGPSQLVVVIADDGDGVPDSIREDIFEMGKKGPESDGTGLGLGFVRALTESYGGTVSVADSDEGGAEFRVVLDRV